MSYLGHLKNRNASSMADRYLPTVAPPSPKLLAMASSFVMLPMFDCRKWAIALIFPGSATPDLLMTSFTITVLNTPWR